MAFPFLGELRIVSFNFPPKGWAVCNGQLLPINQNQALFALLGNTYGGDGRVTFALPNLQGRVPIHMGAGFTLGQQGGETTHTLILAELPAHTHAVQASPAAGDRATAAGNVLANSGAAALYDTGGTNLVPLAPASVTSTVGGQPHENMQPYLALNVIIALAGIFPSQN